MSQVNTKIPVSTGQRSNRDLSAVSFGTTDFGRLDVLYHTEVNPSEDITIDWQGLLRGATMPAPTRARMYYDVRVFFVPYRVLTAHPEQGKTNFVWDYFIEKLSNTSHPYTKLDTLAFLVSSSSPISSDPRIVSDTRRLFSQLRLPEALYNSVITGSPGTPDIQNTPLGLTPVNLWPFLSYQRIWWDFYRDKSLIDESLLSQYIPQPQPGLITYGSGVLQKICMPRYACWPKDYFTNARSSVGTQQNAVPFLVNQVVGQDDLANSANPYNIPVDNPSEIAYNGDLSPVTDVSQSGPEGNSLTYAAIRMARLVDNYLQRLNIAGTSLVNRIFARFGVRPSDQVVWSSQYIGGKRYDFTVGDVLSNVETGSVDPQSVNNAFNYGADGSQSGQSVGSIYSRFGSDRTLHLHSGRDYGTLMIIGSLVPYTGYFQGLHRSWIHGTASKIADARAQYLTPEFANAGLQPILKQELFGNASTPSLSWDSVFGFSERYGEYAYQPPVIDGDLVLKATKSGMNALHLFREFSSMPSLSASFTMIDPAARESLDRIFNYLKTGSQDETLLDHFERYFSFSVNCPNRAMASSMLPDLFEDNNHGDVISVPVGGTRF